MAANVSVRRRASPPHSPPMASAAVCWEERLIWECSMGRSLPRPGPPRRPLPVRTHKAPQPMRNCPPLARPTPPLALSSAQPPSTTMTITTSMSTSSSSRRRRRTTMTMTTTTTTTTTTTGMMTKRPRKARRRCGRHVRPPRRWRPARCSSRRTRWLCTCTHCMCTHCMCKLHVHTAHAA